jgi:maltooligosyltrehalose synthase
MEQSLARDDGTSGIRPWRDVLNGQRVESGDVAVAHLWRDFPVALLERTDS